MLTKGKVRSQQGTVVVEFAILLPLLVLIVFGIIEYGVLSYNKQVVTNASREVARAAINPVPLLSPAEAAAAAVPYNDLLIRFGPLEPLAVTPPPADRAYPEDITITVTWDHYFIIPGIFGAGPSVTINSQTRVRML